MPLSAFQDSSKRILDLRIWQHLNSFQLNCCLLKLWLRNTNRNSGGDDDDNDDGNNNFTDI